MESAQIRIVVIDTTGPIDLLYVEEQRRDRAIAFHAEAGAKIDKLLDGQKQKTPPARPTGRTANRA